MVVNNSTNMTIKLCKNYPFPDNSNVFDYSASDHKIAQFVNRYIDTTYGILSNIADVDITSGVVRIAKKFEDANNYNYMIIEKVYNNQTKRYYCFIKSILWSSNLNTSVIHFELDIWNTYRNDLSFHDSYIEREHVQYDTKFSHLVDEGFSPSQYFINKSGAYNGYYRVPLDDYGWVLALSDSTFVLDGSPTDPQASPVPVVTQVAKNQFAPLLVKTTKDVIPKLIDMYIRDGKESAILGVYMLPKDVINSRLSESGYVKICAVNSDGTLDYDTFLGYQCTYVGEYNTNLYASLVMTSSPTGFKQHTTDGVYYPKNNKCFNYPFNFIQLSNHLGKCIDLAFEKSDASNHSITISYIADVNINGCYYIAPQGYDGSGATSINPDYMLLSMNYPTVPFKVSSYDSWYASNQNTLANQRTFIDSDYSFNLEKGAYWAERAQSDASMNAVTSIASAISNPINTAQSLFNFATANQNIYADAVLKKAEADYSYASALSSFKATLNDKALMPTKINGLNAPNALLATDCNEFVIKYLMPSIDELQSIDAYFTKYGYKVNKFDAINLYYRPRFDFKKIPDCNISGNLPTDYLNVIRAMFQQGVTIWHDASNIFDYSDNTPSDPPPQPPV